VRVRVSLLAAAYAALAGLVAAGTASGLDQWAVDHAMPGAQFRSASQTFVEAVVPLLHASYHPLVHGLAEIWTLPAASAPSLVLCGAVWIVLWRRGRHRAAGAWAAAWVAGTGIEVLTKELLTRPELYAHGLHVVGFDASYPSGHTIRAVLLAATVIVAWPAARVWAIAWAAVAVVLTEVVGFHTPTDIVGGLILAWLLIELARSYSD
jgi:membrane-associated phospholipid phosphatase